MRKLHTRTWLRKAKGNGPYSALWIDAEADLKGGYPNVDAALHLQGCGERATLWFYAATPKEIDEHVKVIEKLIGHLCNLREWMQMSKEELAVALERAKREHAAREKETLDD